MAKDQGHQQPSPPSFWRRHPAAVGIGGLLAVLAAVTLWWIWAGPAARTTAPADAAAAPPGTTAVETLPWSFGGLSLPARVTVARSTNRSASRPYWFGVQLWQGVWKPAYSTWLVGQPHWTAGPAGAGQPHPLLVWADAMTQDGSWEVRLLGSGGGSVIELLDDSTRHLLWLAPPIVKADGVFVPGVPARQLVWQGSRVTAIPAATTAALPSGAVMVSYDLAGGQVILRPAGPVTVAVGQQVWLVPGDQAAAAAWSDGQVAIDTATPPAATGVRRGVFVAGSNDVGTVVIDVWYGTSTLPAARLTVDVSGGP